MLRTMPSQVIAVVLLAACEAALGAHAAVLLALLLPLTGAMLLVDAAHSSNAGARIALARPRGKQGAELR